MDGSGLAAGALPRSSAADDGVLTGISCNIVLWGRGAVTSGEPMINRNGFSRHSGRFSFTGTPYRQKGFRVRGRLSCLRIFSTTVHASALIPFKTPVSTHVKILPKGYSSLT
ncbi:protein of unknown function [Kyrpidia spormannii]|uniref:Uncharacterized protein n=1 Tax=Kyrpidia spormannii TaxID=2055160 RepID=A0A6F9ECU0_9BACL|nr:protein of unknown function [Kyrpidia spormannii]